MHMHKAPDAHVVWYYELVGLLGGHKVEGGQTHEHGSKHVGVGRHGYRVVSPSACVW